MLTLLSQYGAGIAPIKPGFDTYHVLPQMGPLTHIKTVVPSVKGDIQLELENQADTFTMNLVSPKGTEAIIGLPKRSGFPVKRIVSDGKTVWQGGGAKQPPVGLRFIEETEHYIKFSAQPGYWKLSATY